MLFKLAFLASSGSGHTARGRQSYYLAGKLNAQKLILNKTNCINHLMYIDSHTDINPSTLNVRCQVFRWRWQNQIGNSTAWLHRPTHKMWPDGRNREKTSGSVTPTLLKPPPAKSRPSLTVTLFAVNHCTSIAVFKTEGKPLLLESPFLHGGVFPIHINDEKKISCQNP